MNERTNERTNERGPVDTERCTECRFPSPVHDPKCSHFAATARLDAIVDVVLAYKPKAKSKPARRRKRRAAKLAKAQT